MADITLYPYAHLGHASHGWLDTRHHFSFAEYYDAKRMGFGVLRVINDDVIKAGTGFDTHPHRDMEIITYVRQGAITHRDNQGNKGRTVAGDVQVMSAGSGIAHAEHNEENEATILYQIWIKPNQQNVKPRWEAQTFPKEPVNKTLALLVSGREEDAASKPLFIYQDAAIYGGRIRAGTTIRQKIKYQAYILASEGEIKVENQVMHKGDGAEIRNSKEITIEAVTDAEVLVIDVP